MLNFSNHQGNTIQNHSDYHLTPVRMAVIKKKTKITSGCEDVEKLEPLYTLGGMQNGAANIKNCMEFPQTN